MSSTYRAVFTVPGAKAFFFAGVVGRMPLSMLGIGVVTMMSQISGHYGIAGGLSATVALSGALLSPYTSLLVDRYGQRRVLPSALAVTVLAVAAFLVCVRTGAPDWTLFLCLSATGVTPSLGTMTRARWSVLYRDSPLMHTAFSLESVCDEIVFIVGPMLSIGLCTFWFPAAGPLLAAIFLAVGGYLLIAQRSTEPPPHPRKNHDGGTALRSAGLRVLVGTFMAMGTIFGAVDVATVAFAQEQGHKAAASLVLAAYALGSCVAAIVFGTLSLKGPASRTLLVGVCAMALSTIAPLLVGNLWLLAVALFVSGLSVAPTMVTTMTLVERLIPRAKLTEGMTWTSTGLTVGFAVGASVAGAVIDSSGAQVAYVVSAVAAVVAVTVAFMGRRQLRPAREPEGSHADGHDENDEWSRDQDHVV